MQIVVEEKIKQWNCKHKRPKQHYIENYKLQCSLLNNEANIFIISYLISDN